jgi:hypothetical protein
MAEPWHPHRWLSRDDFRAGGYVAAAGEIDYGMRWGDSGSVRVSFAPHADGGYL